MRNSFPFYASVLFLIAFFQTGAAHSQVSGCKDPAANNYNPSATVNDGSCTYNTTTYTPPVKVDPMNTLLQENSGLQWAGGSLWTFNDGGGAAAIYRIDTLSNAILQTVTLGGATNVDWEDIAFDGTYFYVGDFGNNATGIRMDLKIYKFPISAIASDYNANPTVTVSSGQIETLNFKYSDQTDFSTSTQNNTRFDCEAMIVDGGVIHLFSKNWVDVNTTHYVLNSIATNTYVAMPLETLATGYLVTAADKAPGKNIVALLGYQASGFANHFMHVLSDYSGGLYFNGNKRRIDLPNVATMGQAEGLCFRTDTYGYISNERFNNFITVDQRLRSFNTAAFTPVYVLPLELKTFTVQPQNGKHLLNWSFASAVTGLQLLHTSDGTNFSVLENIGASAGGSFLYEPFSVTNCYELMWRQATGSYKYSNVVCSEGKTKPGVSNVVLRRSGELSFVLNDAKAGDYLFRLLSADGRLLGQTTQHLSGAGVFTVRFPAMLSGNDMVLVQMGGKENQYSQILRVQE